MASDLLEQVVAGAGPNLMPLTVEQYHRMAEAGILQDGDPVELIDGLLVWKDRRDSRRREMNHGPAHAMTVNRLFHAVNASLSGLACYAQCQLPITLPPRHEPEPDVSVIVGSPHDYHDHLPGPADTLAVMEVADSSLRFDRSTKQRVYADAGVPVYWLIDLTVGQIEIYSKPSAGGGRYEKRDVVTADQTARLMLSDGAVIEIPAADVLP